MDPSDVPADTPQSFRPTARSLPIALLRARERVMEPYRGILAKSGMSEQKWRALRVVAESGPMKQTAIAEAACLLLPSLTRLLAAMEADGLISRRADSSDRRKSIVTITADGRDLILQHVGEVNRIAAELEAAFGKEKLSRLLDLLEELRATS